MAQPIDRRVHLVRLDLAQGGAQILQRAHALEVERGRIDFLEALHLFDGALDDRARLRLASLAEQHHGAGGGIHAQDIGAVLEDVVLVVLVGEALDQFADLQIVVGIHGGALVVADLEQDVVAVVVEYALVVQQGEVVAADPEAGFIAVAVAKRGHAVAHLVQYALLAERIAAVGAALQLVLFDAERLAHLQYVAAVARRDHPVLVVGVELPLVQNVCDIDAHLLTRPVGWLPI